MWKNDVNRLRTQFIAIQTRIKQKFKDSRLCAERSGVDLLTKAMQQGLFEICNVLLREY